MRRSVRRTKSNVKRVDSYISKISKEVESEKAQMWVHRAERSSIAKEIRKLQNELSALRKKTDPGHIQEMEVTREKLSEEVIITLRQKLGTSQTEMSTLQSQFDNVLRVGYQNSKIQTSKVETQLRRVEKELEDALQQREDSETRTVTTREEPS